MFYRIEILSRPSTLFLTLLIIIYYYKSWFVRPA